MRGRSSCGQPFWPRSFSRSCCSSPARYRSERQARRRPPPARRPSGTPVIFFAVGRHAAGPGRQVRQAGRHADDERPHETGRDRQERPHAGLPAQHGRRLVHALDRHVAGRARLDEQHLPPRSARGTSTTRRASPRPASSRPTTSARRPSGRARPSSPWSGSGRGTSTPALQGPVVDFRTFIGGRGHRAQLRPARPAGGRERVRRPVPAGRPRRTRRAGRTSRPPSAPRSRPRSRTTARRCPANGVWDVYIYDSTNDGTVNYDRLADRLGRERQERRRRRSRTSPRASGPTPR